MESFVTRFLKASLVWLALGVTLGLVMAVWPAGVLYRPAHLHMTLLGFVTMMIYGVGYHVIPRFTGHPLHSRAVAIVHWWLANLGLGILVAGFLLNPLHHATAVPLLAAGGGLSAVGAYCFVYNIWRTMDGPAGLRNLAARQEGRAAPSLPVVDRPPR